MTTDESVEQGCWNAVGCGVLVFVALLTMAGCVWALGLLLSAIRALP